MRADFRLTALAARIRCLPRIVLDAVLPPGCAVCAEPVPGPNVLCADCWSTLDFIEAPRCDVYGLPLPFDTGGVNLSVAASRRRPPWGRARAAVGFDDRSRKIVHALKYHDRHEVVGLMATLMRRAGADVLNDAHVLVPVPLHWSRLWARRFNQAAMLSRAIARETGTRWLGDALVRRRATRAQVGLDAEQRRSNVKGAFVVREHRINDVFGRHVVLVDDVMTTGATAGACARALKQAGAAQVDALVFALVLNPPKAHV